MAERLHVLHSIASLNVQAGGTSRVAVDFTAALARLNLADVTLLTQAAMGERLVTSHYEHVSRVIAESDCHLALRAGMPLNAVLGRLTRLGGIHLVHSHGLWLPVNHWTSRAACKAKIPLVIQPHGMLEPWALNHRAWKKRTAMALFQRDDLLSAKALIATSFAEFENIRKLGFRQPIAVIPNGVSLDVSTSTDSLPAQHADGNRTILFLSRVHPKKGLENLVRSWAQMRPLGWRLRIAGPDEGGYLNKIIALVGELGIETAVEYVGSVDGGEKVAMYRDADLFVLPTFSENFGVVVAEALAHGLPVITTRGAPWADLETFGCGWWIDIGVDPLVHALREAMALSDEERRAMGARGRDYVRRYDWDDIAQQTIDVYRWVLGQGPQPDCVRID